MTDDRRRPSSPSGPGRPGAGRGKAQAGRSGRGRPPKDGRKQPGGRKRPGDREARDEFWAAADGRAARAKRAGWGGVARRGTKNLHLEEHRKNVEDDRERHREDLALSESELAERRARRAEQDAARAEQQQRLRSEARAAIDRGTEPPKQGARRPLRRDPLPPRPHPSGDPRDGIRLAFGDRLAPKMIGKLSEAADAYGEERFPDAARLLKPLVDGAPDVAEVRELNGLALYRLGRWKQAARELESFRTLSGSTEQHPVLADCYRAMGRWADVDELWDELRAASPSAALVTEGRIVAAGALADRGQVEAAIEILGRSWRRPKRPRDHHLRRAYALADLYERAGDVPRARDLFAWIQRFDPSLGDVRGRLAALRS